MATVVAEHFGHYHGNGPFDMQTAAEAALNLDDLTARVELVPFPISLKCGCSATC
ncbi:MAG: hypothetical protein ABSC33_03530 [Candidatus Sulfotelmatobacter sp.]|jgi:hypothetical protein